MRIKHSSILLLPLVLVGIVRVMGAENYRLDWFKIAGGGGTSTNGLYSLSGAIGQHDAGEPMTNGQYSVTGGFWVMPTAVQVPGAPTLKIVAAAPGQVTISWSPNTAGYRLQETLSLAPAAQWIDSTSGSANPVTLPITSPTKCFRLIKPSSEPLTRSP